MMFWSRLLPERDAEVRRQAITWLIRTVGYGNFCFALWDIIHLLRDRPEQPIPDRDFTILVSSPFHVIYISPMDLGQFVSLVMTQVIVVVAALALPFLRGARNPA